MITTTVGSYPKVAEDTYSKKLIGSISRWQRKELTDAGLESVFREITAAVIGEQENAGIDVVTDGQIRWEDLVTPVARKLSGFEINGLTRWFDNNTYYRQPVLRKAPKRNGPILVSEYRLAAKKAQKPLKAVLPGPYTMATTSDDQHYKKLRPFVLKMAEILNEEARALAKAGAPIVQFDEPALVCGKPNIKLALEAIRIMTRGISAKTALYTYYGSPNGILTPLLGASVDIVGVDVVSNMKALSALRRTKVKKELAIGCVDGRNTKLESVTELHAIFDLVRRSTSIDRIYVNPNCGLEFLPHEQALAKLRRLVEAVRTYE